jgi:hypothetical protein
MNRRARDNIVAALQRSGGRIYGPGGAAELLGISPSTLNTREKLGLKKGTSLHSPKPVPEIQRHHGEAFSAMKH